MKNKKISKNKGFTLVEMMVVLVILALLAAIMVPTGLGYINKTHESMCKSNRGALRRSLVSRQLLDNKDSIEDTFNSIKGKELASEFECPKSGEFYVEYEEVLCSFHDEYSGELPDQGGNENLTKDENHFYLGGDPNFKVETWGDLEKFDPRDGYNPGTIIKNGTVFYYKEDYYLFRDDQYLTQGTNLQNYVNNFGIKINYENFAEPGPSTSPGDVKVDKNGKAKVFFPYGRYENDYNQENWWYEIKTTK